MKTRAEQEARPTRRVKLSIEIYSCQRCGREISPNVQALLSGKIKLPAVGFSLN